MYMTESIHNADDSQNVPSNTTICVDDNGAIEVGVELPSNSENTPCTPATVNDTSTEAAPPIENIESQPTLSPQQGNLRHHSRMSLVLMRVMTVMGIWDRI